MKTPLQILALETPVGCVVAHFDDDALRAVRFGSVDKETAGVEDCWELRSRFASHFAGKNDAFDGVPIVQNGTPFQQDVWAALQRIPFGATCTYGALAAKIGRPGAARAVGAACGANQVFIVVPCHRVIGANGSLTGFAGGIDAKRALLASEHANGSTLYKPAVVSNAARLSVCTAVA